MLEGILKLNNYLTMPSVTHNHRSHEDVHYLWQLRKALVLLLGNDEMLTLSEQNLIDLHTEIVRGMISTDRHHWYDNQHSKNALDLTLPLDLKEASDGYWSSELETTLFETHKGYSEYMLYLEADAVECWTAPAKRGDVPVSHFFDSKNKKYPYKNKDGSVNCGGVLAAKQAAAGARSGNKASPAIRAKINRVWDRYCIKKEK